MPISYVSSWHINERKCAVSRTYTATKAKTENMVGGGLIVRNISDALELTPSTRDVDFIFCVHFERQLR